MQHILVSKITEEPIPSDKNLALLKFVLYYCSMEETQTMTAPEQLALGRLETEMKYVNKSIDKIDKGIEDINKQISASNEKLDGKYMSKDDFKLFVEGDFKNIKALVYGFVILVLIAVVGSIIALVVVKR